MEDEESHHGNNPVPKMKSSRSIILQCSPFSSAQQVKEFFKLVEHLWPSLLIMSAYCIIGNRNMPHFSPLHARSFALISLRIQGSEFGNMNVHDFFFLLPIEFLTIPGHFRW